MTPHFLSVLVMGVALLASPAQAQPSKRHEVSLGATTFFYRSFQRSSAGFTAVEAAYHQRMASEGPWSFLRLGGGLRTGFPATRAHVPLEGFLQVQLLARIGLWEAMVGSELGLSGFAMLSSRTFYPMQELKAMEDDRVGSAYMAFGVAPARLHFGRVVASALELQLGTNTSHWGSTLRMQLGLLRLGVEL